MLHLDLSLLLLLAVAAAVALLANRTRIPFASGLVVAGLILGNVTGFAGPHLTKDLLFLVVLPGLLFEAAFQLHFQEFWKVRVSIFTLAVPGLIVSTLVSAGLVWFGVNALEPGSILFVEAMIFGALISATDPISVLSLFRTLGVDSRLSVMVEGESLLNDGTAVVIFTIVLSVAGGATLSVGGAALEFVRIAGLAAVVGAVIGAGISQLMRSIDDPMIEITLTVLGAYGAFIVAESLGLSGVIACVISGMILGAWGARVGMRPATRVAVDSFWTYGAFILNSFVFLLVGFEVNLLRLMHFLPQIILAWVAINLARAAVVYAKYAYMRITKRPGFPLSWATVLTWGGLRGALSMVLALALPANFIHRELILHLTFGVVLLTLLVQGLTISPLVRALGLGGKVNEAQRELELRLADRRATEAGLQELQVLHQRRSIAEALYTSVQAYYQRKLAELGNDIDALHAQQIKSDSSDEQRSQLMKHLAIVEKEAVGSALRGGLVTRSAAATIIARLDAELVDSRAPASVTSREIS